MGFLARLQDQLESIHGLSPSAQVEDYLVGAAAVTARGSAVHAPEQLVLVEGQDGMEVGLYIDPQLLRELSGRPSPVQLVLGTLLPSYCAAAEGVSHWLYVQNRAHGDRQVSQLELEAQAEVDKFASCVLGLWQLGLTRLSQFLRQRLFDQVSYFPHLPRLERERYQAANAMARAYSRQLDRRFVGRRDLEGLLRELRVSYRMSGGEKYARLAAG